MRNILILFILFSFSSEAVYAQGLFSKKAKDADYEQEYASFQSVRPPELPRIMDFAGEHVPLENFDTRESLERELTVNMFWHSQTIFIIKLANRFFPMIEPILRKNGVPDDLKYLCVAESGLQQVVSPAKAVGFWQILGPTGKELGLEINNEVDERYNIEKSTEAACTFLKKSHEIFGSWTMAAASYNMGRSGLTKQVVRQKSISYHDLTLGEETSRYLFRILALKLIISNPTKYGFHLRKDELYPPYKYREVIVNTPIPSWADFAHQYGTNYKILKMLNPWLREAHLTNKNNKVYYIKVPEAGYRKNAYSN